MDSDAICALIQANSHGIQVSCDGSAFDSTQYAALREAVEKPFWIALRPWLENVFAHTDNVVQGMNPSEAADEFIKQATTYERTIFVKCPDAASIIWTTHQEKMFKRFIKGDR